MKKLDFSILTEIKNLAISKGVISNIIYPKKGEYVFGDGTPYQTYLERCLLKNGMYGSEEIKMICTAFIGYLESPFIFDTFPTHGDRRVWQQELEKIDPLYRDIVKRNRLSRSMIQNVVTVFEKILHEEDREQIFKDGLSEKFLESIKYQLHMHTVFNDNVYEAHRIALCSTTVVFTRNVIMKMMEIYDLVPVKIAL